MHYSKTLKELKEPLDIDIQLIAAEMDTSAKHIRFVNKSYLTDAIAIECFNRLLEDIESGEGVEVTSFSDNAVLYEYLNEAVIVYTNLADKFILFDAMITQKIEHRLNSYKE